MNAEKVYFQILLFEPNYDCKCTLPVYLALTGFPSGEK